MGIGLAIKRLVPQTSAQGWIEEDRPLPRLYRASKRRRRMSTHRVRIRRTVIALMGSILWVVMIRYLLHLG